MAFLAILSLGSLAHASTVTPRGQALETIGSGSLSVPVYRNVDLTIEGSTKSVPLFLTGDGERVETIIFDIPLYAGISYISVDPATIDGSQGRDKILSAVMASPIKVIELTMLNDLTALQIRTAFKDAFRVNGVDVNAPVLSAFLNKINFPFSRGLKLTIVGYIDDRGTTIVRVERPGEPAIISIDSQLSNDFWKVWFGKTDTSDVNIGGFQDMLIKELGK